MICFWPQNTPQFPISLLHWSQISFPGEFFCGLQTASSCWGLDLENRVCAEEIRCAIHVVLLSLRSTCNTVHCLRERALFSSSFVAIFWWFIPSNAPILLYNIRYWWFFLSQVNRSTKYQNKEALPADIYIYLWSLWTAFTCCCQLSWLPIWLQSAVGDLCFIHCHIFTEKKILFVAFKTVANNALNRRRVAVFGRLWANAATTLNTAFSLTNVHSQWWIHCLLISSTLLLSHATSIYDRPKRVCGVFWYFPGQLPNLGDLSV